ncbi:MAG: CaiB/BaiF CoA-transferase family protein [Acidobacteriota bacterium]
MEGPLTGTVIVDASRMLPGAVLDRLALDLGATVVKVEDPAAGDPLRHAPPLDPESGVGAAFASLCRGAESVCLDLREEAGAASLRRLCRHADVLVESFRPGTMEGWGLGWERVRAVNPRLLYLSLSGYGHSGPDRDAVGHDLNFTAASGLLSLLPSGMPRVPLSDIAGGVLGFTALLAALLERGRTGKGRFLDQPLSAAAAPFLAWPLADLAAGGGGLGEDMLSGRCPAYRLYAGSDGREVAVCCLEPKFWEAFLQEVDLPDLAGAALERGEAGEAAAARIAQVLARRPSAWWTERFRVLGLPVSPVRDLQAVRCLALASGTGDGFPFPPLLASFGRGRAGAVPRLGEHRRNLTDL